MIMKFKQVASTVMDTLFLDSDSFNNIEQTQPSPVILSQIRISN